MGKRGFAPKPTNLRLLHGDKKNRINLDEPIAPDGALVCPETVSDDVRAIWDYTVDQLLGMQILKPADRDSLLCYVEAVATHRKASALLAKSPVLIQGHRGVLVRNPAIAMQRDAAAVIRAFAHEFGLTPSARSEIRMGTHTSDHGSAARLLSS